MRLKFQAGTHTISEPIVLQEGDEIVGDGMHTTEVRLSTPAHCVIDTTGASNILIQDIKISYMNFFGDVPTGILLSRSTASKSVGNHRIRDVIVEGRFRQAAMVDYGAEDFCFHNLHLGSLCNESAAYFTSSRHPIHGHFSNVNKVFDFCFFRVPQSFHQDYYTDAVAVQLEGDTFDVRFTNCMFRARHECRAVILCVQVGSGFPKRLYFSGTYSETWGARKWVEGPNEDVTLGPGRYNTVTDSFGPK